MSYDELADVYEFTVPDALLTPAGSVTAFGPAATGLAPGSVVLDCACGTGVLAVGLAEAGHTVVATDASAAMVARTRSLAEQHRVSVDARVCAWEDLAELPWDGRFDAVFCVGNSITHARGSEGRRSAFRAMARVMRPSATLVLTSRNWELQMAQPPGISVSQRLIERNGRRGVLVYDWHPPPSPSDGHQLDIGVAIIDEQTGDIETYSERLAYWPFTHAELEEDLEAVGLRLSSTTYEAEAERYLVTAELSTR